MTTNQWVLLPARAGMSFEARPRRSSYRDGSAAVLLAVLEHKLRLALAAVLARKVVAAQLEGGRAVGLLGASANFPAA